MLCNKCHSVDKNLSKCETQGGLIKDTSVSLKMQINKKHCSLWGEKNDKGEFYWQGEDIGSGAFSFMYWRIMYSDSSGCWALYQ